MWEIRGADLTISPVGRAASSAATTPTHSCPGRGSPLQGPGLSPHAHRAPRMACQEHAPPWASHAMQFPRLSAPCSLPGTGAQGGRGAGARGARHWPALSPLPAHPVRRLRGGGLGAGAGCGGGGGSGQWRGSYSQRLRQLCQRYSKAGPTGARSVGAGMACCSRAGWLACAWAGLPCQPGRRLPPWSLALLFVCHTPLVWFRRDDKAVEDATTAEQLASMFHAQVGWKRVWCQAFVGGEGWGGDAAGRLAWPATRSAPLTAAVSCCASTRGRAACRYRVGAHRAAPLTSVPPSVH